MAKIKQNFQYLADGTLDISAWIEKIKLTHGLSDVSLLNKACLLTQKQSQGLTTFYGQPYLEYGLEIASILLDLKLDQETAAASILLLAAPLFSTKEDVVKNELGDTVAKLVKGVQQMDIIPQLQKQQANNKLQLDKIRKMLLAMATDIRVVIIKLAERLCFLRGIKSIPLEQRKPYAEEIFDIYAPLANRLGMGQLKWELEDLAFYYQNPNTYKTIASFLAQRRVDRENRIQELMTLLQDKLKASGVIGNVTGRAKHIYSIYLKAKRKNVDYQEIYDHSAVRILVPTVEDCYTALSIVHHVWPPIMQEFDDYIAHPKPNGYRSIHTAVIGDDGKHFEIQIRTNTMHEEAERGVAAHWMYKEKGSNPLNDASKITYLRQLLDWHQEIAGTEDNANTMQAQLIDDQVYVITPAGEILDLVKGSTPLDFAYYIHSELGNRCRGAKVNGHIVPLTHQLQTGDRVEIITVLHGTPSRDWMNPELGYLKSARARNKISHWFKQQELAQDIDNGRELLERELTRNGLAKTVSLAVIARQFGMKNEDALLASLSRGNIRISHILHALQPKAPEKALAPPPLSIARSSAKSQGAAIAGGSDFLTRFAKCCKPIPGDDIIGYITYGRGISIHKKNCNNVSHLSDQQRFIQTTWDEKNTGFFSTDLTIVALEQEKTIGDLTSLFANEKIDLLKFHSNFDKKQNKIFILVTVQIQNMTQLNRLLHRLQQLPSVIEVMRVKD